MIIADAVYGREEITEAVLIELVNSPTLQRLTHISQLGMPEEYSDYPVFSRFEHSLGVLILLRRLGAGLHEQTAGLIHDVSHTAFSHLVDWIIGDPTQENHQDNTFLEVLYASEIPRVLKTHSIDVQDVEDIDSFSLLEQPAPRLCADRVDYTLRQLAHMGVDVDSMVSELTTHESRIVFRTQKSAELFGRHYMTLQKEHWSGAREKAKWHLLSGALKRAMQRGLLTEKDFLRTDEELLTVLRASNDEFIQRNLELLRNDFSLELGETGEVLLTSKFRYVDPEYIENNTLVALSTRSESYADLLEKAKKRADEKVYTTIRPL